MRWYLERGQEFVSLNFDGATVVFEDDKGASETLNFDSQNDAILAMRERIKPLFQSGYDGTTHPDDRFKQDPEIQRWWLESFESEICALNDAASIPSRGMLEQLETDHCRTFSPDLRRFLAFRDTHSFGWTNFNEWRIWDEDLMPPDFGVSNRFERLILMDQNNYLGTAMAEAFFGGVFIGTAGNGDSYYATPGDDPNRSEVVIWDHEVAGIEGVMADSVSSFAYLNRVLGFCDDEDVDEGKLLEEAMRIAPHVKPSWHYNEIFSETGVEPAYEGDSRTNYYYWRMIWVNYLLRQDGVRDMDSIPDLFVDQIHSQLNFEEALEYQHVRKTPMTQFYWLWRLFFFDKGEQLAQMLELAKVAPSPLVRDCAALIQEFLDGRTELGKIRDIHALRRQFIELDLDPDRAEDRIREEMEREASQSMELAQKLEEVHALIAKSSDDELLNAALDYVDSSELLDVIYEHLSGQRPQSQEVLKRVSFVSDGGASRDGRFFSIELDEVKAVLSSIPKDALPLMVHHKMWAEVGATQDPRAVDLLLPVLKLREKYHHALSYAAQGLRHAESRERAEEVLNALRPLILELRWDAGNYIEEIGNKTAMRSVIEAVGAYGQTENDASELMIIATEGPESVRIPAMKAASQIFARAGEAPEDLYKVLGTFLEKSPARPALYALANLGTKRAKEMLETYLEIRSGDKISLLYERIMLARLLARQGERPDIEQVLFATNVVEKEKFEDLELHLVLVDLIAEYAPPEIAQPVLLAYLDHHHADVRRKALSRLKALDVIPFWADRVVVDEVAARSGISGLTRLLEDPEVVWKHNVLRKAVELGVDDDFVQAAGTVLPQICRYTNYTGGWVSYYHDNISYALEAAAAMQNSQIDAVLGTILSLPNNMYAKNLADSEVTRLKALAQVSTDSEREEPAKVALKATSLGDARWLPGGAIHGLAISPNKDRVYAATTNGLVVFDPEGQVIGRLAPRWLYDVQLHGDLLAVSGHSTYFALIDANTLEELHLPEGQTGGVRKARFSPSGALVATVTDYRMWSVIDTQTGALLKKGNDSQDINGVDWIDEETFVVATDREVAILTTNGDELARKRIGASAEVRVAPDQTIYVGTPKGIQRFDKELNPIGELLKQASVARIEFRDGKLVVGSWAGKDSGVWIWDVEKGKRKRVKGHDEAGVFALCLDSDGWILAGGNQRSIVRWGAKDKLIPNLIPGHLDEIAYLGEGREGRLLSVSDDRKIIEWDVEKNTVAASFGPFDFRTTSAKWSDDADMLLVAGFENIVALSPSGEEIWRSTDVKRSEYLEVVSDTVVAASGYGLVWLNRLDGKMLKQTPDFADSFIFRWVRMDPRTLVCAGYDDVKVFVVDLEAQEIVDEVPLGGKERMRYINRIDDERVVLTQWDDTLKVINIRTKKTERIVQKKLGEVAFHPDQKKIYAWSGGSLSLITSDGIVEGPFTSPAPERAQYVNGKMFVGAKTGMVFQLDV